MNTYNKVTHKKKSAKDQILKELEENEFEAITIGLDDLDINAANEEMNNFESIETLDAIRLIFDDSLRTYHRKILLGELLDEK